MHSAWSADNVVPSESTTATPFFDVKTTETVVFKRTWPLDKNSAASAWINVLNPRWSTERRFSAENALKV